VLLALLITKIAMIHIMIVTIIIILTSDSYVDKNTYGISVFDRIKLLKDMEQGMLTALLSGSVKMEEIEEKLRDSLPDECKDDFMTVLKEIMVGYKMNSATIDIFIPEAIPYGVNTAKSTLRDASRTCERAVTWSNTNLAAKDYTDALNLAMQNKRSVRFVRWGVELPRVTLKELISRNLLRFIVSGRYIPVRAISSCLSRAEALLEGDNSHEALAFKAGFDMDSNGILKKSSNKGPFTKLPEVNVFEGRWKAWFSDEQAVCRLDDVGGKRVPFAGPFVVLTVESTKGSHTRWTEVEDPIAATEVYIFTHIFVYVCVFVLICSLMYVYADNIYEN
jgi:hypothetical protein